MLLKRKLIWISILGMLFSSCATINENSSNNDVLLKQYTVKENVGYQYEVDYQFKDAPEFENVALNVYVKKYQTCKTTDMGIYDRTEVIERHAVYEKGSFAGNSNDLKGCYISVIPLPVCIVDSFRAMDSTHHIGKVTEVIGSSNPERCKEVSPVGIPVSILLADGETFTKRVNATGGLTFSMNALGNSINGFNKTKMTLTVENVVKDVSIPEAILFHWAWYGTGFNSEESQEWSSAGFSPDAAKAWYGAGFSPATAKVWQGAGFSSEEATAWKGAMFSSDVAQGWHSAGFSPGTAKVWQGAGFNAEKASKWSKDGFNPQEATQWNGASYTPDEYVFIRPGLYVNKYGVKECYRKKDLLKKNIEKVYCWDGTGAEIGTARCEWDGNVLNIVKYTNTGLGELVVVFQYVFLLNKIEIRERPSNTSTGVQGNLVELDYYRTKNCK